MRTIVFNLIIRERQTYNGADAVVTESMVLLSRSQTGVGVSVLNVVWRDASRWSV